MCFIPSHARLNSHRWAVSAGFRDLTGSQNIVQNPGETFLNSDFFFFFFGVSSGPLAMESLEEMQGRKPMSCSRTRLFHMLHTLGLLECSPLGC